MYIIFLIASRSLHTELHIYIQLPSLYIYKKEEKKKKKKERRGKKKEGRKKEGRKKKGEFFFLY